MEEALAYLGGHSQELLYVALFLVLLLCGVGLPVPEDVPLITAGFLAYQGTIQFWPAVGIALVAVLAGDTMIFFIGRHWGLSLLNHRWMRRLMPETRLERVRKYFNKFGDRTVFFARFIVGLRAATFWAAGTLKMGYPKFILFDGLAALISVPTFVFLGKYFGDDIERALHLLERIETIAGLIAVTAIGVFIFWEVRKRKHSHE